jgi:hypothetical protein
MGILAVLLLSTFVWQSAAESREEQAADDDRIRGFFSGTLSVAVLQDDGHILKETSTSAVYGVVSLAGEYANRGGP